MASCMNPTLRVFLKSIKMKYKLLGNSGLRVSELCLGTMTFGEEWGYGADAATSKELFDLYTDAGGNFYDTANRYTEGTSEKYLGKFIKDRGNRHEAVVATKYALFTEHGKINDSGNHRKNLVQSVEGSLERLGTDYIDLLYLHAWDFTTPVEEVMRGLDDLIRAGKVLYIGISDTPAWIVSKANTMAELKGWTSFITMQAEYSLIKRDVEREIIPMCDNLKLGVTAWAALGAGVLTGKYLDKSFDNRRLSEQSEKINDRNHKIAQTVVDVAKEIDASPSQIALAWMRQKWPFVFPIIGSRKPDQIKDNLECLNVSIPEALMQKLDDVSAIEMGFPHDFIEKDSVQNVLFGGRHGDIII